MITRARVQNYKTLRDVEVTLEPLTVIFGPNSAGKSNLYDAFSLLSRIATRPNLEDAFKGHRGSPLEAFSFGPNGVEDVMEQESADFLIEADIQLSSAVVDSVEAQIRRAREGLPGVSPAALRRRSITERRLRYGVRVEIRTASGHLRVIDEYLVPLRSDGQPSNARKPFLEKVGPRNIRLRMEKQGHPSNEEVGQDRSIVSKGLYPPHYPHIAALREELSRWRFYYLEPTAMREEVPLREVDSLDQRGTQIAAFFNTLLATNDAQFRAVSKALHQVIPNLDGIGVERTPEGFVRLVVSESGMRASARVVSEGTLRVLALLAITNPIEPVSVVGYEEPENGVHPRRLELVANLLRRAAERGPTQLLINTHSPILPEYFEGVTPGVLLRCYRESGSTQFERFDPGPLFIRDEVEAALDEDLTPFRERVVRGDFGG
jgi:predicted ATPase